MELAAWIEVVLMAIAVAAWMFVIQPGSLFSAPVGHVPSSDLHANGILCVSTVRFVALTVHTYREIQFLPLLIR